MFACDIQRGHTLCDHNVSLLNLFSEVALVPSFKRSVRQLQHTDYSLYLHAVSKYM